MHFVDKQYQKENDYVLEDILGMFKDIVIVVGVCIPWKIGTKSAEWKKNEKVLDVVHIGYNYPAGIPFLTADYLIKHWDKIMEVYGIVEDALSRKSMEMFLKTHISGDSSYLEESFAESEEEYFTPLFGELKDLVVVDGGAYIGDTYEQLIGKGISFSKYYAFEPDKKNAGRMYEFAQKDKRLKVIEKGLYSKERILSFVSKADTSSKIIESTAEDADDTIQVTSIDTAAGDADFIKLDIEGSEYEALKGAENTIKKNKPYLAVCCYHKVDDIWNLPLYIKNIDSDYRFYFRQHIKELPRDLVLYAVPNRN